MLKYESAQIFVHGIKGKQNERERQLIKDFNERNDQSL